MINPFSFAGRLARIPYFLWIVPVFLSQYAFVALVARWRGVPLDYDDLGFYAFPLRMLVAEPANVVAMGPQTYTLPNAVLFLAFVFLIVQAWAIVALSYRRVVDARVDPWLAPAAIAPLIQIAAIGFLCVIAHGDRREEAPVLAAERRRLLAGWSGGLKGLLAGMALTLAGVAMSALVFGSYGFGIFLLSPFLTGFVAAFAANLDKDMSADETSQLVLRTALLGGLLLVVTALEGVGCLVMAAPLGLAMAWVGGLFGRAVARSGRATGGQAASSVAVLPLVFAIEAAFPPSASFHTEQSVRIEAPVQAVWQAVVDMDTITEPVALHHRIGIAYPVRGRVLGEGVGALRHGEFSTGTAVERVTEWQVNRRLAFVVLQDVAGLRELSPYRHVHAPHVHGYFRTLETSFTLTSHAGGGTDLIERTTHELRLDPALYWLPFARYMVDQNNARVLRHIKRQAERTALAAVR